VDGRPHTRLVTDPAGATLLRLAAFTTDPRGGNPAGVWIGASLPSDQDMLDIAADVGYSETAFIAPDGSGFDGRYRVRYFSPLAEVPFCGHATIATGVALGERALPAPPSPDGPAGEIIVATNSGPVPVSFERGADGHVRATLTSVATWVREPGSELLGRALELLGWQASELDPALPPAIGFAGAKHLILVAREAARLSHLDYPFEALKALMLEADLTTLQLAWREAADRFRARDPFPVGGVVEDPATGAAAAALGAYLRERGEIVAPASFEISQGVEMGRPSRISVSIATGEAGVRVSGTAVPI
jgi:PhzF family phenazine biosynthesis protein